MHLLICKFTKREGNTIGWLLPEVRGAHLTHGANAAPVCLQTAGNTPKFKVVSF